jgi:hypothetical protein
MIYRYNNDIKVIKYYKHYCNILSKVIQAAKKNYYNKTIMESTNKMKTTWRIINAEQGKLKNDTDIESIKIDNKVITNTSQMAETFNKYFLTIANSISSGKNNQGNVQNSIKYLTNNSLGPIPNNNWQYTSTIEIKKIIISLRTKKSYGYDEVSIRILKLSAQFIISPLTYICNKSLNSGVFPDRLKYAIVRPIFKKGNKLDISNYRPISLLSTFSKVFEKVIYTRIQSHLEKYNMLVGEQYGFRANSSTEKAIYKLINDILEALNNKIIVGGLFCDLHKAFDCVDHGILLRKLEFYGIVGKIKTLIESYFNRRNQKVILGSITSYNCISSDWEEIKCGVPQGSILGPLFFLLYINDLPNIAKKDTKVILYADDTSVLVTSSNKTDFNKVINEAVRDVNRWFRDNLLSLNLRKTQYLNFRTKNNYNSTIEIIYEHKQIPNSSTTKFLGLNLDDTLTWKNHIELVTSKLCSACFVIRNIKPILSLKVKG